MMGFKKVPNRHIPHAETDRRNWVYSEKLK